jgi:acyl-CoA synthetase (NDP forming)
VTRVLELVFNPRRVAVVGASDRPGKMGTTFMRNLAAFAGEVVPVTTSQETVDGRKAYPRLQDIPGGVDLAVLVVPAGAVPGVMADAAAAGVGAAIVISGGFAEAGPEGAALQRAAVEAARAGGVRVVGPNCFGVQNCNAGLNASMATGTPPAGGDIALATQSGAYGMAIYTLGLEQDLRFSKVYAAGNKADVGDAEVLEYLGADPESSVLCFFLESLDEGRAFYERARAITPHKPIIVAKTGRTEAGARAATSHTAALAGNAKVWDAAFGQAGVVVARSGLEMVDAAKALDWQPVPAGPRVGIVTNSGGTGVELTDLMAEEGLVVPELTPGLQEQLAGSLPAYASPRNPVDVTPNWARFAELYPLCLETLARSGEVDAVVLVLLQRSALDRAVAEAVVSTAGRLRADQVPVPVYVCWVAPRQAQGNADLLQSARIPCFEWPERTARALGHARRYGRSRAGSRPPAAPAQRPADLPELGAGLVPPDAAAELLRAFGVEVAPQALCAGEEDAAAAAARLGYPVVAKVVSERLVHKTEAGGVRLGLADEAGLRAAVRELLALDGGARVLLQAQCSGEEVIVGGFRDAQAGPVVMVGLGGVFVEVLADVVFRLAPIDEQEAAEALAALRGHPVLAGVRGRPGVDLGALATTLAGVSRLLDAVPEVAELDLNPVLATPQGATAVDVRVLTVAEDSTPAFALPEL